MPDFRRDFAGQDGSQPPVKLFGLLRRQITPQFPIREGTPQASKLG